MSDSKTLQSVQDNLSANQRDKVDFIQAEQNVLYNDIGTFAKLGRQANPSGYSAQGFKLYEHHNSPLMLSELRALDNQEKISFIKKGRLLDGTLTPVVNMQRVYRNPLDKTKILGVTSVPLDNFFLIKKATNKYAEKIIRNAEKIGSTSADAAILSQGLGANYEKLKYGLTSLDFVLKNQNPFAASRMVDVTIQFTLESILALDFANPNGFKLRELITFSKGINVNQEAYGGYSLRLALGYADVSSDVSMTDDPETAQYIKQTIPEINNMILELELVDYDISMQDKDSSATLTLNYVSFIEDYSKKMSFDIFAGKILSKTEIQKGVPDKAASSLRHNLEIAQSNLTALKAASVAAQEYNQILAGLKQHAGDFFSDDSWTKAYGDARATKKKRLGELRAVIAKANYITAVKVLGKQFGGSAYIEGYNTTTERADIDEIVEDTQELQNTYNDAKGKFDAKIQEINDRLLFQNKIAKYNIILENIFRSGKVYEAELETKDLVFFSNEATLALQTLVKENAELAEAAAEDVNELTAGFGLGSALNPEGVSKSQERSDIEQVQGKKSKIAKDAAKSSAKADDIEQNVTTVDAAKAVAQAKKVYGDENFDEVSALVQARVAGGGPIPSIGDKYKFYYIYLGDIVDAALANNDIYSRMNDAKTGVILGSLTIPDPNSSDPNKAVSLNLADFPISLKYFIRFFKKNIIEKDIDKYDVTKFLQDIATQLVSPAINSLTNKFGRSHSDPVQIKITTIPLLGGAGGPGGTDPSYLGRGPEDSAGTRFDLSDPVNMYYLQSAAKVDSVEQVSSAAPYFPIHNYFYMYGTKEVGFSLGLANSNTSLGPEALRAQKGVYSFNLGGEYHAIDLGYTFQKVKKKYQTEMMAARAMEKGEEYREAWNQYDLTIEMLGNSIFYPGMHIYSTLNLPDVNYVGADPFLASNIGLEGYYLVTNVENKIEGQFWTTTLTAKWQSSSAIGRGSSRPLPAGGSQKQDNSPKIDG